MNRTLKIVKDFNCKVQGELNPLSLPAGTMLTATKLLNNGTPFLSYQCEYEGKTIYVQPRLGYVVTL